jgi:RNA polymerase sigma-70 factor, ECF subfamily
MAMTISIDDRRLVESYQAGDSEAFSELVRAHGPSLLGHAIRKLGDRAAAEDAVQETFVRAYRALPRFDGDYRLGSWLHRILSNVCADEGNRRRREAEKFDRFAADPFAVETAPGVEDELGLDLDDVDLASALASLSPSYREVLNLRFVQELPYDEVARAAGVTEENARARVSRARNAARSALRGVAAIPALLIPTLRRGESVAAAATHTDSVRVAGTAGHAAPVLAPATDVVMAASQASTPLLTKAVIGLSVVAAVAAPSGAPSAVEQSRAIVAADTSIVADEAAELGVTAQSAGTGQPVAPVQSEPVARAGGTASGTPDLDDPAGPASSEPAPSEPVTLPATPPAASDPGDTAPAPSVTQNAVRGPGDLALTGLVLIPSASRFDLTGDVTLVVGGRTFAGLVAGNLAHTDLDGVRSYTATLVMVLGDGKSVDVRLQLRGYPVADQAELDLDEVTAFDLLGMFGATSGDEVALLESGSAIGSLDLQAGILTLTLAG